MYPNTNTPKTLSRSRPANFFIIFVTLLSIATANGALVPSAQAFTIAVQDENNGNNDGDHNDDDHGDNGNGGNDQENENTDNGNHHDEEGDDHEDNGHGNDSGDESEDEGSEDEDTEDHDNGNHHDEEDDDHEDNGHGNDSDEDSEDDSEEDEDQDDEDESEDDSDDEDEDSDDESEDEDSEDEDTDDESEDEDTDDETPVDACSLSNILANGSFEATDERSGIVNAIPLNLLGTTLPNWDVYNTLPWTNILPTTSWYTELGGGIEVEYSGVVANAQDGSHYIELDSHGESSNTSMSQSVTLPAGDFTLSFWYMPRTESAGDNTVNVYWDNALMLTVDGSAPATWTQHSIALSNQSAGAHEVTFAAAGTQNSLGGFIDTVTLTCGAEDDTEDTGGGDEDTDDETDNGGGGDQPDETGTLTVTLEIINDDGGDYSPDDFDIYVGGEQVEPGSTHAYAPGVYEVTEDYIGPAIAAFRIVVSAGYGKSYSLDCGSDGSVTITPGNDSTCQLIINDVTKTSSSGSSGGTGGSGSHSPTPSAPAPRVLGETDEIIEEPVVLAPIPQVLGATDELPRTGGSASLPMAGFAVLLLTGIALAKRPYEVK